ncbi:hypothetical protein [Roseobacter sp. S98]|uniref:hypothetical protein n=1 Tax=Roseobacter algicola (ex Choi et al. 2025) (nom. illeg.) TaxID=3092138 RepID=UPI0035C6A7F1
MVAYSFKKRFSPRIEDGTKIGTIRGDRKRHARVGEAVQLYQGMRTRFCRKIIPDPICVAVKPIRLHIETDQMAFVGAGVFPGVEAALEPASFNTFARQDGFDDMADMHAFWLKEHGTGVFRGFWILWAELSDQELGALAA